MAEVDAAGNVTKSYGYKPGSTWTTDPLFMKVGGQYYFYQNDHLGTPQKLTAVNGAVVWSAKYPSFGEAEIDPSSTIVNNLRFPGQYFDEETGLHYNRYRYYDSKVGRYIRFDPLNTSAIQLPISIFGKDIRFNLPQIKTSKERGLHYYLFSPGQNNFYNYVVGNSINFIDPLGLFSICKWKKYRTLAEYGEWKFSHTLPPKEYIDAGIVLTRKVTCYYKQKNKITENWRWECICDIKIGSFKKKKNQTLTKKTPGFIYPAGQYHASIIICDKKGF